MWATRGAWMMAGAGAVWGASSAYYGDWKEAALCATFAVGFILVARGTLLAGALVAALPAAYWLGDAVARGRPTSAWALFGLGGVLLALAVALRTRTDQAAMGARAAFALVALASLLMLVREDVSVWSLAPALAMVGAGVLVMWPPVPASA